MIVVRNVFRLKFGQARDALAIIKEGVAIQKRADSHPDGFDRTFLHNRSRARNGSRC
jgi:hypothetical protein